MLVMKMTKEQLEQYRAIQREISALEDEIDNLHRDPPFGTDIVTGSDDRFPYCKRNYKITGIDHDKLDKLIGIYRRRIDRLTAQKIEVEQWLDTVEDSIIRQIVQLRYMDGFSWGQTASKVYKKPCENIPRMALNRFLEKNS